MIFKTKLTPLQEKHLESIRWLISHRNSDRRHGRTFVLAYALLLEALDTPNEINIIDHTVWSISRDNHKIGRMVLLPLIQEIILENDLPIRISKSNLTIQRTF